MAVTKRILPFMQSPVSRVLGVKAVFMMGIDKGVKEAHHHNTILKASQEHTSDQVAVTNDFSVAISVACLQKEIKMFFSLGHSL